MGQAQEDVPRYVGYALAALAAIALALRYLSTQK
jgi:hypothetical protein